MAEKDYIDLSIKTLLVQHNKVIAIDIINDKIYTRDIYERD